MGNVSFKFLFYGTVTFQFNFTVYNVEFSLGWSYLLEQYGLHF